MCWLTFGHKDRRNHVEIDRRPARYRGEPIRKRMSFIKDAPGTSYSGSSHSSDFFDPPPPIHPALAFAPHNGPVPFATPVAPQFGFPGGGPAYIPHPQAQGRRSVPPLGPGFVVGDEDAHGVRNVGPGFGPTQPPRMLDQRQGGQFRMPPGMQHRYPERDGLGFTEPQRFAGVGQGQRSNPTMPEQWSQGGQGRGHFEDERWAPGNPNRPPFSAYGQ
ncbi:MAG: hypothetical protein M1814_000863 [Vezdaea aestivalis]|nr:MAG: hypothetical protein M1814_000863 [Vezdaea aestivalis]